MRALLSHTSNVSLDFVLVIESAKEEKNAKERIFEFNECLNA